MILTEKILKLSDEIFHEKNLNMLRNTLRNNNYPVFLIDRLIKHTKEKLKPNIVPVSESIDKSRFSKILFKYSIYYWFD